MDQNADSVDNNTHNSKATFWKNNTNGSLNNTIPNFYISKVYRIKSILYTNGLPNDKDCMRFYNEVKNHIIAGRAVQTVVDARMPEISVKWNPSKFSVVRYLPNCISPTTNKKSFVLGNNSVSTTICNKDTGPSINHAVTIVGFGEYKVDNNNYYYYVMQNSYGGLWGFNGICRIDHYLNAGLGGLGGFAYELKKK